MCNIQVSTSRQLFLILFCLFFNFNFNFLEFNIAQRTYGLLGTVCVWGGGGVSRSEMLILNTTIGPVHSAM